MFLQLKAEIDAIKSIKNNIEKIEEIYLKADTCLDDNEYLQLTNFVKSKIQSEALKAWEDNGCKGIIIMATGCGKSRIPILYMQNNSLKYPVLVVPTEKLRDNNWKEEYEKTESIIEYQKLERHCYASISKIESKFYDFVILDEVHNITELNSQFIENNITAKIMMLTATLPSNGDKIAILEKYGFKIDYEITISEAIRLKMVSPYELILVECNLNNTDRTIQSGNKKNPFKITEAEHYRYLNSKIEKLEPRAILNKPEFNNTGYGFSDDNVRKNRGLTDTERKTLNNLILKRTNFIYNLNSKTNCANTILKILRLENKEKRILIFCGTIDQSEKLCEYRFNSKTTDEDLIAFMKNDIQMLSCVNAINEGINIPSVDIGLIVQLNNNEKNLIQRIGRIIRYKQRHIGKIIIIYCKNTEDEKWMKNTVSKLNVTTVREVSHSRLLLGLDKL